MRRSLLALFSLLLPFAVAAGTVTVQYSVRAPDGSIPASVAGSASLYAAGSGNPAYLSAPQPGSWDAATGLLTWSLPADRWARILVPTADLAADYWTGEASPLTLNDALPGTPGPEPGCVSTIVPYVGAAADVNLGAHGLFAGAFRLTAAPSAGYLLTSDAAGNGSWQPPPNLSLYAPLAAANIWTQPQEFDGGFVAGGVTASDALPLDATVAAPSAYQLAATHTTGGNLYLAGGLGSMMITIADYTQLLDTSVYLTLNLGLPDAVTYTLTEGIQFSAVTDNPTTANALASAINAWCPGLYATASGAVVGLQKTAGTVTLAVSATSTYYTLAAGPSGAGYLTGLWHSTGSLSLDATTQATFYPHTYSSGEINLSVAGKTVLDVTSGTSLWSPQIIGGVAGQIVIFTFEDAYFYLADGGPSGTYNLNGNFTSTPGATLVLIYTGTQWREISRSLN